MYLLPKINHHAPPSTTFFHAVFHATSRFRDFKLDLRNGIFMHSGGVSYINVHYPFIY